VSRGASVARSAREARATLPALFVLARFLVTMAGGDEGSMSPVRTPMPPDLT